MNRPPTTSQPVIQVQGLGKAYRKHATPRSRLKILLTGHAQGQQTWALQNINFSLQRGQCLGLIGSNGAGKSTLLKLLASTLTPTTGSIKVAGRLTAILELGAGFHPEFTGRENLYFGGSLIGLSQDDITRLMPEITAFSELQDALDRPVKTYSSGMAVRLAFALVTAVEPDVLIIDEALAVGDQHFQKKCIDRINRFRANGCTILFCSHSLYHIRQICDVAIWIDHGAPRSIGPTEDVLAQYEAHVLAIDTPDPTSPLSQPSHVVNAPLSQTTGPQATKQAQIVSFTVDGLGSGATPLLTTPNLVIHLVASMPSGAQPHFGVMIEQASGRGITSVTTHTDGFQPILNASGMWQSTVTFTDLPLFSGEYVLSAYLFDATGLVVYEEWPKSICFRVLYPSTVPGLVRLPHHWS